jgi:uncharacterized protein (DUF2147 family)
MKTIICILLGIISINCLAKNNKVIGKWKTEDKTIVEIVLVKPNEYKIKQISSNNTEEAYDNGKIVGEFTSVSSNEWKGLLFDTKEQKSYQAKFVLTKDGKLLVSVKWGLLSYTENWEKV